ncbi:metalloprotease mig-17-like [Ruditapes philippinarum]|uniref:metalloprotease mig-17-like n=1 Tax=Ruditapes philippinarum TaxID=129788 RepID=UPI00295B8A22|nr:metalloprotease mig-17-like [Ruditapes philippinarum]
MFFFQIDLYFCSVDTVDPDYSIKIYLAGVVIPKADSEVLWSKNAQSVVLECYTYLDMSRILSDLTIWHQREEGLPQHDFLIGLSTLDLADLETTPISTGFEGISYRESVCSSENKVSFVEVDGTRVALTAAHELAHGLGAFHDGEEDAADCPASAQNIMSPEITLTTNLTYSRAQWSFSACSVASFKSYIDRLEKNCLKQHAFTGLEFEELQAKSLPGTVYSLNQQCQMYNGIWSTSCESTIKEEACYTGYHCSTRSDLPVGCEEAHHPLYPLAGTPCGALADNKWCYRGRCVGNTSPTTTTSSPNICTTTTSTSTTTSTTEAPTTTTVAPCKQGKQCCVKVNGKKKCCKGTKCCKIAEAAQTDCYKSCCDTDNTTQGPTSAPCFGGKCCSKIEVNGALKKVCCKKAKCCKTSWGKETKCCLTCSKR